jgi:cytidylate kinase
VNAEQIDPTNVRAITISRQYGSGGGEIAARLARRVQWQLIDHEIVAGVASELGITEEEAEVRDERVESFVSRVLASMRYAVPPVPINQPVAWADEEYSYHETLCRVVETAASAGHTVIVGRGGQALLAGRRDVLHVRVVAPLEQRIVYVARREGLDEAGARARIQLKDRDRTRYVQSIHHIHPDDPLSYDLVVNTGVLDLDSAVDLICLALERKARKLGTPATELGPAAGLAPYPGHPADLRPPAGIGGSEEKA